MERATNPLTHSPRNSPRLRSQNECPCSQLSPRISKLASRSSHLASPINSQLSAINSPALSSQLSAITYNLKPSNLPLTQRACERLNNSPIKPFQSRITNQIGR